MISAQLSEDIATQQATVDSAYNDLNNADDTVQHYQQNVDELQRQIDVHLKNGDTVNANIVSSQQMPSAQGYLTAAKTAYNQAMLTYRKEFAKYLALKNKLSPNDRKNQDEQDNNDPALNGSGLAAIQAPAATAAPATAQNAGHNYMQGNTLYFIIGGTLFIILTFGAIVISKISGKKTDGGAK